MFDLMSAIHSRQRMPAAKPADVAETAENAQSPNTEPKVGLRKPADLTRETASSTIICNHPHDSAASVPTRVQGSRKFPADPQNPKVSASKNKQAPDAVLLELAITLKADSSLLRALLSEDDMQAIAEGEYDHRYLLAYFRLMRSDGRALTSHKVAAPEPPITIDHVTQAKPWEAAHGALINHLMACTACYAPRSRYCPDGQRLCREYRAAYQSVGSSP